MTPNIRGAAGGPTATVTNGLIAERSAGLESELASTKAPGQTEEANAVRDLERAGVKLHLFSRVGPSRPAAAWGLSPGLSLWLMVNLRRYDILHLQYVWCWTTIIGCAMARFYRVPVVLTPHESLTNYDIEIASDSRVKGILKKTLRRFILGSVDALVLMSGLEERDTDCAGIPVHRVPHTVMPARSPRNSNPPGTEDRAPGEMRIGFIGRQIPKKGIDRLIRAVALSTESGWTLDLAGPPPKPALATRYHNLVRDLGLEGRVRWLGFVEDRDAFLSGLDVLAMPSEYEGFGMAAAEAMSCGTPVVVPRESGIAELVETTGGGLVIETPNPDEIAAALQEFSKDPDERQKTGERAEEAIEHHHSPEIFAARTREIYEGLTGFSA